MKPQPFSLLTLMVFISSFLNAVHAQLPQELFGVVDNSFVSVSSNPTQIENEIDLQFLEGKTVRTLAFYPIDCRFYGIVDSPTQPVLIWFDYEGNNGIVGQLTLGGVPLPMCEAIAFNPIDNQLYASVSTNGNPSTGDYDSESIVKLDQSNAECLLISKTNQDIDAMEFVAGELYVSNTENNSTTISKIQFQNIPSYSSLNLVLYLNEVIYIVDLAYSAEKNIIYYTSGNDLYEMNLAVEPLALHWLGATHDQNEFNGERMLGLTYANYYPNGFEIIVSNDTAFFVTEQIFNSEINYYWNFGDGNLSTEYSPIHIYAKPGNYEACLTITYQNCTSTNCEDLVVLPSSIMGNGEENTCLKVSPNPTGRILHVQLFSDNEKIQTLQIFNLLGQLIYEQSEISASEKIIDMIDMAAGEYFIVVNKTCVEKFIKM